MLEPRRLAAKAAARRLAALLGERVGQTVGFRVRHEAAISSATRIEVRRSTSSWHADTLILTERTPGQCITEPIVPYGADGK